MIHRSIDKIVILVINYNLIMIIGFTKKHSDLIYLDEPLMYFDTNMEMDKIINSFSIVLLFHSNIE